MTYIHSQQGLRRDKMKIKDFIAVAFSSLLLTLAFPSFSFWPLAWFGMVPLFIVIQNKSPLQSFWLGWTQGILFYLGTLTWIINTMVNYGNLPLIVSVFLLALLAMYLGVYTGLFCFFLARFKRNQVNKWIAAPFIWVSLEYIKAHILTGFPWASLGYSQFNNLQVIQIADVTGVYGLSFLIIFVNVSFFLVLDYFYFFQPEKREVSAMKNHITAALFLLIITFGYGSWKSSYFSNYAGKKPLKVALIQGNIDQSHKWDILFQNSVYETYKKMTLESAEKKPDLIVWPETATPFSFSSDRVHRSKLLQLGKESGSHILFGSPNFDKKDRKITLYNSAYLISPEKKVLGQYDKIHLVPFGEYVPFKKLLFFVDKMVVGIGDFGSGTEHTVFSMPKGKFSTLICFEVIFPDLVRRFVKEGAEFLVNITNDAWFGKSAASYQHISMVVFRAVENRRPIIRAANTGVTGIINSRGEIISQTDIFARGKIIGNIYPEKNYQTIYTRYGDFFAIAVLLCTIIYGGIGISRKKK